MHILLVDDDLTLSPLTKEYLEAKGLTVTMRHSGDEGLSAFKSGSFDGCILDVRMPLKDGFSLAEDIRQLNANIPILFLTGAVQKEERIRGLALGADDYITKPIKPRVLLSRINALLRRSLRNDEEQERIELQDLVIDKLKVMVFRGEESIELPRKEFEILWLLASKPGRVFTREEIFDRIWGKDVIVGNRTIDVHIRKLRERLGEDYIKTLKGIGYKFDF